MPLYSRARASALLTLVITLLNPPPVPAEQSTDARRSPGLDLFDRREPAAPRAKGARAARSVNDLLERIEL